MCEIVVVVCSADEDHAYSNYNLAQSGRRKSALASLLVSLLADAGRGVQWPHKNYLMPMWHAIANRTTSRILRSSGSIVGRLFTQLGSPNDTDTD